MLERPSYHQGQEGALKSQSLRCVSREVEPRREASPPTDLERRRSGLAFLLSAADFANLSQVVLLKVLPGRSVNRFLRCE